ncbi:MAG: hypothetical protein PHX21_09290 [bacterium]|nr:hypothetical protein [bacterium]
MKNKNRASWVIITMLVAGTVWGNGTERVDSTGYKNNKRFSVEGNLGLYSVPKDELSKEIFYSSIFVTGGKIIYATTRKTNVSLGVSYGSTDDTKLIHLMLYPAPNFSITSISSMFSYTGISNKNLCFSPGIGLNGSLRKLYLNGGDYIMYSTELFAGASLQLNIGTHWYIGVNGEYGFQLTKGGSKEMICNKSLGDMGIFSPRVMFCVGCGK